MSAASTRNADVKQCDSARALEGIRILEWAQFINGPTAGLMLADLGADVIKIEHPLRGDASRGAVQWWGSAMSLPGGKAIGFEAYNRNKRSITLDLEKPEAREVLYGLVKKSDVFLTNFAGKVAAKLGADYDTLCRQNPKIIYARTSVCGGRGPEKDRRGFDFIGLARSGMMMAMGDREEPPGIMVGAPTDQLGSMMLAYGIVVALLARERLGVGQLVDTSMLGAAMHMQLTNVAHRCLRGQALARHSRTKTRSPFSNYYCCADGEWLMLSEIQVDRFWPRLCRALGMETFEHDPRFNSMTARRENGAQLISILTTTIATRPVAHWVKILGDEIGIACSRVYSISDLPDDPQVLANDYVVEFDHPALGRTRFPGFPVHFSRTPALFRSSAPELGQHTEEVLLDLGGCSWEQIAGLKEKGAI